MRRCSISRRTFLTASAGAAILPRPLRARCVASADRPDIRTIRFAVIADLHHGLAPDALDRLRAFADSVRHREELDFVLQMGDFCHAGRDPGPCLDVWNAIEAPRFHILGNHDMDTCTKEQAMQVWGMPDRHYEHRVGGWRFLTLDLNHIRKGGNRTPYANANFYVDAADRAWADPEQLDWLRAALDDPTPTVILSHQPLGMWTPGDDAPPQQHEVLDILAPGGQARPGLELCMCGHLHVDRWEVARGLPCWCVNSASYFWHEGMVPYERPLFAFVTLEPTGVLTVEGVRGEWSQSPEERGELPAEAWVSPSIGDHHEKLAVAAGR